MLKKIRGMLKHPSIKDKIGRIINCDESQPLVNMVLFAEWLEQKHKRGYVVCWTQIGVGMFQVFTVDEWTQMDHCSWIGPVHWRTSMCDN